MSNGTRAYRFVVEYLVEPGHPAYDDPEWAADAAWGALANMYGLLPSCTSIEEIDPGEALQGAEQSPGPRDEPRHFGIGVEGG